jgi:nucleoside-diphosphate-sugar epimerase
MKLIVTGATGYIGKQLLRSAQFLGHDLICLCRKQASFADTEWMYYDLEETTFIDFPLNTDAVIHLATNKKLELENDGTNEISSACVLLRAALRANAKFIFVSSQTARKDAPTLYGRTKWAIEQHVLAAGGWVIRPGQVYGGDENGLFGTLISLVRRLPVLPAFLPSPMVQPVHVADISYALLIIAERSDIAPSIICIAAPHGVTFKHFLSSIANERLHVRRLFFPVPSLAIRAVAFILGEQRSKKLGIERLISLFALPPMETSGDLKILGLTLRPLQSGMRQTDIWNDASNRRALLREARVLLTYILKRRPSFGLQGRYVRVVEKLRNDKPLQLPSLVFRLPLALALLDDRSFTASPGGEEFLWRLDAATSLAEGTTSGATRFIGINERSGVFWYGLSLVWALSMETMWRLLSKAWLPIHLRKSNSRDSNNDEF